MISTTLWHRLPAELVDRLPPRSAAAFFRMQDGTLLGVTRDELAAIELAPRTNGELIGMTVDGQKVVEHGRAGMPPWWRELDVIDQDGFRPQDSPQPYNEPVVELKK
jgi:hypothetical protein